MSTLSQRPTKSSLRSLPSAVVRPRTGVPLPLNSFCFPAIKAYSPLSAITPSQSVPTFTSQESKDTNQPYREDDDDSSGSEYEDNSEGDMYEPRAYDFPPSTILPPPPTRTSSRSHPQLPATFSPTLPLFSSALPHISEVQTEDSLHEELEVASDLCFCGKQSEEESIYCSITCGRKDALGSLCGDDTAMTSSPKAEQQVWAIEDEDLGGSHYRRTERRELRRDEKERARRAETHARQRSSASGYTHSSLPSLSSSISSRGTQFSDADESPRISYDLTPSQQSYLSLSSTSYHEHMKPTEQFSSPRIIRTHFSTYSNSHIPRSTTELEIQASRFRSIPLPSPPTNRKKSIGSSQSFPLFQANNLVASDREAMPTNTSSAQLKEQYESEERKKIGRREQRRGGLNFGDVVGILSQ